MEEKEYDKEEYQKFEEKWDAILDECVLLIEQLTKEGKEEDESSKKGMYWVTAEGKTLNQAIENGLQILGERKDDVDIEVLYEALEADELYKVRMMRKREEGEEHRLFSIALSNDELDAYISIHDPAKMMGMVEKREDYDLSVDDVLGVLKKKKVVHGIDTSKIEEAIKEFKEGADITNVLIAKGEMEEDGRDAEVEHFIDYGASPGEIDSDSGTIDFKEKNFFKSIGQGELMARKVPSTPGKTGKTATGRALLPIKGRDKKLRAGRNVEVEVDENGNLSFISTIDGTPVLRGDKLEVLESTQIGGDVDYHTGNIDCRGDVQIGGKVLSGFRVMSYGDIFVFDLVEAATLVSGGGVFMSMGIKGQGMGRIIAKGDVKARYIERADIECGGNLIVENVIMDSNILCGGKVYVTGGKGCIIGGKIKAAKGVEAKKIGSELSANTRLIVGINFLREKQFLRIKNEIKSCRRDLKKIASAIEKAEREESEDIDKLLSQRENLKTALDKLINRSVDLAKKITTAKPSTIKVINTIYPRVLIRMGRSKYMTTDKHNKVMIYMNSESKQVTMGVI